MLLYCEKFDAIFLLTTVITLDNINIYTHGELEVLPLLPRKPSGLVDVEWLVENCTFIGVI